MNINNELAICHETTTPKHKGLKRKAKLVKILKFKDIGMKCISFYLNINLNINQ